MSATHTKRLRGDIAIIQKDPIPGINILFDETNILVWYFLVIGRQDSHYAGGEYIGKITFDERYPYTPPEFYMETPNGRFLVSKKICLSNSKFHMSEWKPTWTIHSIINAFVSVMYEDTDKGVSHIKMSQEERKKLASQSREWNVKHLPKVYEQLSINYLGKSDAKTKSDVKTKTEEEPKKTPKMDMSEISNFVLKSKKMLKQHKKESENIDKIAKDIKSK